MDNLDYKSHYERLRLKFIQYCATYLGVTFLENLTLWTRNMTKENKSWPFPNAGTPDYKRKQEVPPHPYPGLRLKLNDLLYV